MGSQALALGWQLVVPDNNATLPLECILFDTRSRRLQGTALALELIFGWIGGGRFYYNDVGGGVFKVIVTAVVTLFVAFVCILLRPRESADASAGVRLCVIMAWGAALWVLAWQIWDAVRIANQESLPDPADEYCLIST